MLRRVFSAAVYDARDPVTITISKGLKTPNPDLAMAVAANMVKTIPFPLLQGTDITLIPVPDSKGSVMANQVLCDALRTCLVKELVDAGSKHLVKTVAAVHRVVPLPQPSHELRKQGITVGIEDHIMARAGPSMFKVTGMILLVDNVCDTETTLKACASVLPDCSALVYARTLR